MKSLLMADERMSRRDLRDSSLWLNKMGVACMRPQPWKRMGQALEKRSLVWTCHLGACVPCGVGCSFKPAALGKRWAGSRALGLMATAEVLEATGMDELGQGVRGEWGRRSVWSPV